MSAAQSAPSGTQQGAPWVNPGPSPGEIEPIELLEELKRNTAVNLEVLSAINDLLSKVSTLVSMLKLSQ